MDLNSLKRWIDGNPCRAAALGYAALTCVMTWPMIPRMGSMIPAGSVDLWQNYWTFWWWKKSLLELHQSPFQSAWLFFPVGADLTFYTHSMTNMLLGLPISRAVSLEAAYNSCLLFGFWTAAWFMFLLAYELTGSLAGAFLAGIVYSYFPQRMDRSLEQLNLFSVQYLPLTLYFLHRVVMRGGWLNAAGLSLSFVVNGLTDWHLAIKLSLLIPPCLGWWIMTSQRPRGEILKECILAGAGAAAILLPAVWPMLRIMASGDSYYHKVSENRGIDPFYLFLPPFQNPLLGWATARFYAFENRSYPSSGYVCYLGFLPTFLVVRALWGRGREMMLWLAILLVSFIFALGAHPIWRGETMESVTLPFAILRHVRILSLMRLANRLFIISSLALAVLVALGWSSLDKRWTRWFGVVCVLLTLEFAWWPYPMQSTKLSPYYATLRESGGTGAVLDIPFGPQPGMALNSLAQTVHEQPIFGGYVTAPSARELQSVQKNPILSDLSGYDPPLTRPFDPAGLRNLGVRKIIMHKDRTAGHGRNILARLGPRDLLTAKSYFSPVGMADDKFDRIRAGAEEAFGPPEFEDETIAVFDLGVAARPRRAE